MTTKPAEIKPEHSPLPWRLEDAPCEIGCCKVWRLLSANDRPLGTIDRDNAVWLANGEAEANAALIVSSVNRASAMEALLEDALTYPIHADRCATGHDAPCDCWVSKAFAILAAVNPTNREHE